MPQATIKAVLFDLGETLIDFGQFSPSALFRQAARNSYDYIRSLGKPLDGFAHYLWYNRLGLRLHLLRSRLCRRDFDALDLLRNAGTKRGLDLTDEQWLRVHACWYEPLGKLGKPEPNLAAALARLRDMGLAMGILSNTFVHASALDEHLERFGLLEFFPLRMYSYQYPWRKPNRRIFLEAARRLNLAPNHILFIGDRIDVDVKGATRAGMMAILKSAHTNAGKLLPPGIDRIDSISQLPAWIEKTTASPR